MKLIEGGDSRFTQLRHGLAGIDVGRSAVVCKHVRLDFTQVVARREQAKDMT